MDLLSWVDRDKLKSSISFTFPSPHYGNGHKSPALERIWWKENNQMIFKKGREKLERSVSKSFRGCGYAKLWISYSLRPKRRCLSKNLPTLDVLYTLKKKKHVGKKCSSCLVKLIVTTCIFIIIWAKLMSGLLSICTLHSKKFVWIKVSILGFVLISLGNSCWLFFQATLLPEYATHFFFLKNHVYS